MIRSCNIAKYSKELWLKSTRRLKSDVVLCHSGGMQVNIDIKKL